MNHKRAVVNAHFEYFIASLLKTLRINFIQKLNLFIAANDIFINLFGDLMNIFAVVSIYKFVDDCRVLFLLTFFKRDDAIIFTV